MAEEQLLESANRLAGQALSGGKSHASAPDLREGLRRGKIVTRYDSGLYKVALRGKGGLYTTELDFVPTFMDGDEFEEEEEVAVLVGKTAEEHAIFNVGGGCLGASIYDDFGTYFDSGLSGD